MVSLDTKMVVHDILVCYWSMEMVSWLYWIKKNCTSKSDLLLVDKNAAGALA